MHDKLYISNAIESIDLIEKYLKKKTAYGNSK